jgi:hypothetical protein
MKVDWTLFLPLLACWVLCMAITGPGMWSEKWGHGWLEKAKRLVSRDDRE